MKSFSVRLASMFAAGLVACSSDALDPDRPVVGVVEVSPTSLALAQGATGSITATVRDERGNTLTDRKVFWTTRDATIATVSGSGVVTALRGGAVDVAASAEGKFGIVAVQVTAPVAVATVSVTPATGDIFTGRTLSLTATPLDNQGKPVPGKSVSWSTTNGSVATVSQQGVVTGVGAGTATIRATVDGHIGSASIIVRLVPVARVVVTPSAASIDKGKTIKLTATLYDASNNVLTGRTIGWSTSQASLATVDQTGLVAAKREGLVTITATAEGQSGSAAILVTP